MKVLYCIALSLFGDFHGTDFVRVNHILRYPMCFCHVHKTQDIFFDTKQCFEKNRKCTYNLIYEYYLTEVRIGTGLPLLTKYHCTVVHILYTILLYVICVCACENVYYQIAKLKINVQCRYYFYLYPYEGQ